MTCASYAQRILGVIPAFLTGFVMSLFIFNYMKGKPSVDDALYMSELGKRPMSLYPNERAADEHLVVTRPVNPSVNSDPLTLLILVFSHPEAKNMRQAVRNTWASDVKTSDHVIYFFVVEVLEITDQAVESLEGESRAHSDLVFLNEKPSPVPNSRTLLAALQWAVQNFQFKFLLKCNDASYIVVPAILQQVEKEQSKELVWGFFAGNEAVTRKGDHAEKDWNLCTKYVPYPQGGGYILSYNIVGMLLIMRPDLSHLDNEDIALGVWLAPFKIQRKHDVNFNTGPVSRGCNNAYLITHRETVESMEEKHESLHKSGKLCITEHQDKPSYDYDWSKPMSDCCILKGGIP